ncbi:MAG: ABC transporter ATP-binding protein [Bacteroidales bacterium]|nr:ABC transporter ATP-binding protein [Bacteroidales bacterium]
MERSAIIDIQNLTKTYKGKLEPAVDNLSFKVYEGEIFGLLGPNGAGKTTTLSVLCTLLKPSLGNIIIGGMELTRNSSRIKRLIGVVSQDIALYERLTAFENLFYFGSLYGLNKLELIEKIEMLLFRLGLENYKNVKIKNFSGGMKRRINLLAGLLHDPKILFLDEPVVGVDVQTQNTIREFLVELKNNNTTIIYTSHLMIDAQELCDRLAIIDYGKLVTEGKPEDIICEHDDCNNLEKVFLKLTGRKLRD